MLIQIKRKNGKYVYYERIIRAVPMEDEKDGKFLLMERSDGNISKAFNIASYIVYSDNVEYKLGEHSI